MMDRQLRIETASTDAELVLQARAGDTNAFGLLLEQHRPMVTRAAARFVRDHAVVDELVQEASLTAFLSLKDLRDPGRFGSWFCGIALNLCRGHVRRLSSGPPVASPDVVGRQAIAANDPASMLEEKELRERVLAAVGELPDAMRSATLLFYYRQMSVREIAASLGITVGAVKVRLNRARRRLWEQLGKPEPIAIPHATIAIKTRRRKMQKVYVADVVDSESACQIWGDRFSGNVVLLAAESGGRALPIWVDRNSGSAIALSAREADTPRPQTFVFMQSILDAVGAKVDQVAIERLDGDTFYAIVRVTGENGAQEIDARPSDAIALASQVNSPIFVADQLMEQAGIDVPSTTALGHGLDALISEFEEHTRTYSQRAPLTEDEKVEAYRKLAETVFGQE